jgi:alpha-methylacyl-CoA racemase
MGPLEGLRVIEIAGIGPGPFCAMLLADMGADVVRVDRLDSGGNPLQRPPRSQVMHRNRRSIAADLKHPDAIAALRRMCAAADALLEGFRPGVMERLRLGPDDCARVNPRLVYGRMTGYGQDGPMAQRAGHDLNYVALSGVLGMLGRSGERPAPPLNIIGDMGGGGLLLAFGMVCAMLEAQRSGRGQVVDASMVEGAALMASTVYELRAAGWWSERRGSNVLDSGAPFYEVYETADGGFMAVGAIEPQFYAALLDGLGLDPAQLPAQLDRSAWPQLKERFAGIFRTRTRAEWSAIFAGTDACVSPVLTLAEAASHPHNAERRTFLQPDGALQAAPAPRFSRSQPELRLPPPEPGEHTEAVLGEFGFGPDEIEALRRAGAIA